MTFHPPSQPFSETLPILLLRARDAVSDRFRGAFSAHGVTEQQWRILRVVAEAGEIEMTPLADATFLSSPSLSRIIKDMAARDLLTRRQGTRDQRRGLVSITAKGLDLIRSVAPSAYAALDEIHRRYGDERLEQMRLLLLELEAVLADP